MQVWKLLCGEQAARVFQTCLDAVREYTQSLGSSTVIRIQPQTDRVLDGLGSAAVY